jgi:hypothetical protein
MTLHVCPDGHGLGIILFLFCCEVGGLDGILGVLQLNVYAKRFIEHFTGFSLSTPSIGHVFSTQMISSQLEHLPKR